MTGILIASMLLCMEQLGLFTPQSWTVSEVTVTIRELLLNAEPLQDLWVQGEISNATRHGSGHFYFTLKDSKAALRSVMWKTNAVRLRSLPREGDLVLAHGSIGLYEASGQYQLYVDILRPAGEGALYQAFLRLKERLEAEGLFAAERKRPIPRFPRSLGIVTSRTGAALRDMVNTIRRRYPLVQVTLAPAAVQGADAPAEIVAGIQALNRAVAPQVILVARGGGSAEDLWAFNDEGVARAIAASAAPVISGVGHETDFTIADFVADLRAATPTAAAERATPDQSELRQDLAEFQARLERAGAARLDRLGRGVQLAHSRLARYSPLHRVENARQRIDDLDRRAGQAVLHRLHLQRERLTGLEHRLAALDPLAVLRRGYAVVSDEHGNLVRSVQAAKPGKQIHVRVQDGSFPATVTPE